MEDAENPAEDPVEDLELNLGTGMHVISIIYTDGEEVPDLDLGDCSPWVALTLLQAAMDSIQLLIPAMNVTYRGKQIICSEIIQDEELDD